MISQCHWVSRAIPQRGEDKGIEIDLAPKAYQSHFHYRLHSKWHKIPYHATVILCLSPSNLIHNMLYSEWEEDWRYDLGRWKYLRRLCRGLAVAWPDLFGPLVSDVCRLIFLNLVLVSSFVRFSSSSPSPFLNKWKLELDSIKGPREGERGSSFTSFPSLALIHLSKVKVISVGPWKQINLNSLIFTSWGTRRLTRGQRETKNINYVMQWDKSISQCETDFKVALLSQDMYQSPIVSFTLVLPPQVTFPPRRRWRGSCWRARGCARRGRSASPSRAASSKSTSTTRPGNSSRNFRRVSG